MGSPEHVTNILDAAIRDQNLRHWLSLDAETDERA
jgi:hypothetical protein